VFRQEYKWAVEYDGTLGGWLVDAISHNSTSAAQNVGHLTDFEHYCTVLSNQSLKSAVTLHVSQSRCGAELMFCH
jgi:hypothetical protein